MKVIKNFIYNASYHVFILLVPLLTIPYLSKVLGPTGVGINSYTNSIIQYFILFSGLGINLYGNREIAFVRDDKVRLKQTFYEIFLLRSIMIVISIVVFILFFLKTNQYRIYYLAQSVSIVASLFDISWFFMGVENFAITVFRNSIIKIITLFSIFIFVKTYSDLTIYILIISLSVLIGNLTLFPSLPRYIGNSKISKLNLRKHLFPSLVLFVPQSAMQFYLIVNKTMLGSMVSVQAAGFFDQSDKMVKLVLAIVTSMGTVMLPHVANAFVNGEYGKTKEYLYKSFNFVTLLSVPMMFGIMAISPKFVPLFFTDKFIPVIPVLMIESIVILLIAWSNTLGIQYLLPVKRVKEYTISILLGLFVNLIINIPLIIMFGTVGTSIATVISELSVTMYQLYILKNDISYRRLFTDTNKYFISGFVMFVIVFLMDINFSKSWAMMLFEVLVGVGIYIFMIFVMRVKFISEFKQLLTKGGG